MEIHGQVWSASIKEPVCTGDVGSAFSGKLSFASPVSCDVSTHHDCLPAYRLYSSLAFRLASVPPSLAPHRLSNLHHPGRFAVTHPACSPRSHGNTSVSVRIGQHICMASLPRPPVSYTSPYGSQGQHRASTSFLIFDSTITQPSIENPHAHFPTLVQIHHPTPPLQHTQHPSSLFQQSHTQHEDQPDCRIMVR